MAKSKSLIQISLTDFIDFVSKSGAAKLTKVKQLKQRDLYSPASDFYKPLREGLIDVHKHGKKKADLDKIIKTLTDEKKKKNYPVAIAAYKKWWGLKLFTWFAPPAVDWITGDVTFKVNPELGLEYKGKFWVIKLYLKDDKLSKNKVGQILSLMEDKLRKRVEPEILFCVLDVRAGKLYCNVTKVLTYTPLLEGEIRSLETIWKSIK